MEDYYNIDKVTLKAREMPDHALAMKLLEAAEEIGEMLAIDCRGDSSSFLDLMYVGRSTLGPDCFQEGSTSYGHFWGLIDTRPYMRTLNNIVLVSYESGDLDRAM